jgi:hypothetical protein
MKRLIYCYDCRYFEIYLGAEDQCPRCGSNNVDIDQEPYQEPEYFIDPEYFMADQEETKEEEI